MATTEKSSASSINQPNFVIIVKMAISNKVFIVICILFFIVEIAYDLIRISIPFIGDALSTNRSAIGFAISAYFVTFTLFQVQINKLLRRMTVRKSMVLIGILSAVSILIFIPNLSFIFVILGMAALGLTLGSLFTYCSVVASDVTTPESKGTYMGVFSTIMPLTDVASPLIAVFLFNIHMRLPFFFAFMLVILFIVAAFILLNKSLALPNKTDMPSD